MPVRARWGTGIRLEQTRLSDGRTDVRCARNVGRHPPGPAGSPPQTHQWLTNNLRALYET